jgi:hypothetical protein
MDMDPVTAIFNFLSTPAGQQVTTQLIQAEQTFVNLIGDLVKIVHDKSGTPAASKS